MTLRTFVIAALLHEVTLHSVTVKSYFLYMFNVSGFGTSPTLRHILLHFDFHVRVLSWVIKTRRMSWAWHVECMEGKERGIQDFGRENVCEKGEVHTGFW
jgi:hypothetical protein